MESEIELARHSPQRAALSDSQRSLPLLSTNGKSSSKRADAVTVIIEPTEQTTDAQFATQLCGVWNDSVVSLKIAPTPSAQFYTLPSCFFDLVASPTSSFQVLIASQVVWKGANASFASPFSLLPSRMTTIDISNSVLLTYDGNPLTSPTSPMDWSAAMTPFPSLNFLGLKSSSVYGSVPAAIPNNLCFFYMDLNHLTGTIPAGLYPNENEGSCESFGFSIASNAITGTIAPAVFDKFLFPSDANLGPRYVSIYMGGNDLYGSIPSNLFCPASSSRSLSSIHVDLSYNKFNGTIASTPFELCNLTNTEVAVWILTRNQLTGDLPKALMLPSTTPKLVTWNFIAGSNPLDGTIPNGFFESLVIPSATPSSSPSSAGSGTISSKVLLRVVLTDTRLTGTITVPDLSSRNADSASFLLYLNISSSPNLTRLNLDANSGSFIQLLHAYNSPKLNGTIPSAFFSSSSSAVTTFDVSNTLFSGKMPDMQASDPARLESLVMRGTKVDFCSGNRLAWNSPLSLINCDLSLTNASYCAGLYPAFCAISSLGPVTTCSESMRPSPSFVCINGAWTSVGSVDTPILTVPSGASTTVVNGNLTSTTVVISGVGSTVIVTGCITNLTSIELILTPGDVKTIGKTKTQILVSSDESCTSDLANTTVSLQVQGNTCKRASVSKSQASGGGTLSGIFNVNSSRCNTWWIILVSVIAGLVVLLAIIAALLVAFVPSVRRKVRPYSKRQATST